MGDHDLCPHHESTHHRHIVLDVMIGAGVYIWVCVGGFTVHCGMCTPSSLMFMQVSKKGNLPYCSGSFVNLMLESRLLRWTVNSSTLFSWIIVNVLSTYLNHTEGGWRMCGEQYLRIIQFIGLLLWATLVIALLVRFLICISLPCI